MNALALAPLLAPLVLQDPPAIIRVEVDPEVELATLVARFAGFREFAEPNSRSPYSRAIEAHFAAQRDHPAVQRLRELRQAHGVSFDAIASLGVHLGPLPELAERVPFDADTATFGGRLDARWGGARAREFVALLRDFAREGRAEEFFAGQAETFREVEARLAARLSQSVALPWFDAFFGARAGASYRAIPGLLSGGHNYGVGVRFPGGGAEEISPVLGCWSFDKDGLPVFGDEYLPVFVHELCHTYTNPIVDQRFELLEACGARLFAAREPELRRQSYTSARIVLYETLVRAVVVHCRHDTEGPEAGRAQAEAERASHFTWVPAVAASLAEVQADRERFPSLVEFMPRIVEVLEAELAELEAKAPPRLVACAPLPDATDVDPSSTALVLTFDQPMQDRSWSLVGAPSELPDFTGKPRFDRERKVLTIPMRLEPGARYRIGLNTGGKSGFRSARGETLAPVTVSFETRR